LRDAPAVLSIALHKRLFDKALQMKSLSILSAIGALVLPSQALAHGGHASLADAVHGVFHAGPLAAGLAVLALAVFFYKRSH
jgi:hypothetical protein